MFYVFHGDEEFIRSEEVAKLRARIAEDGMGDLNITLFDGEKVSLDELMNACNTLPFLTNRRLIVVEDLLQRFEPRGRSRGRRDSAGVSRAGELRQAEKLATYLPNLPPTTRLLFVESKQLNPNNPILKKAQQAPNGHVRKFTLPESGELQDWTRGRARDKGATITSMAASLLLSFVGPNLRLLDQELEKLSAYTGYARPIEGKDVRTLVSAAHEANIFALVDSLGLRNRERTVRQLQDLFAAGASDLYLLAMIARQVRLILSVKDLAEEQGLQPEEIRRELHISHRFIVDKLLRQARRFSMGELEAILRQMAETDQAIKTGRLGGPLAIELLVVETCRHVPTGETRDYQRKSTLRTR